MIDQYPTFISRVAISIVFVLATGTAALATDELNFSQTRYESRYYRLINELRCLVCQNQTLADSNAELARDLRLKTHQLIESGESDDSIIRFMVDRYGDFILYRPPLRIRTMLLWIGPALMLALGLVIFVRITRRRTQPKPTLSTGEQQRLKTLLNTPQKDK